MNDKAHAAGRWSGVQAWVPSPWLLVALIGWWAWRYATVQSLPAFREADGAAMAVLGFVQDGALLYGLFGLMRWREAVHHLRERSPGGRALVEGVALLMLASAVLRALDALHAHLAGSHLSVRFWLAFADRLGDWALGLHTLLIAAVLTALLGRFALRRHAAQGPALMRRLAGPQPTPWLKTQLRIIVVVGTVGLLAVLAGGLEADGTATLPELRGLWTLIQALGSGS